MTTVAVVVVFVLLPRVVVRVLIDEDRRRVGEEGTEGRARIQEEGRGLGGGGGGGGDGVISGRRRRCNDPPDAIVGRGG